MAWQVLKDKDEVAICCIRKRANDAPRLHALVPQVEVRQDRDILAPEGFHVIPLPFADDLSMLPLFFLCLCAHALWSVAEKFDASDVAYSCMLYVSCRSRKPSAGLLHSVRLPFPLWALCFSCSMLLILFH